MKKHFLASVLVFICIHQVVQAEDFLQPFQGKSVSGIDTTTLTGKVMTGYQGWFNCEGDGADLGWTHWARNRSEQFGPGNITVDLWPDVSEYDPEKLYETGFQFRNGSHAKVFSSHDKKTVLLHFAWMREYGIDGAFIQRFANGLFDDKKRHHKNVLLANAREGANRNGRAYAVMYDLSGLAKWGTNIVRKDWKQLREKMRITGDPAYLHHEGKPVVTVWGIGFMNAGKPRDYTLSECRDLVEFFKQDGCTVMLGVPTGWRTLDRDCLPDPLMHEIIQMADIVSPWTPGRYREIEGVQRHGSTYWAPDKLWCDAKSLDYLPVVFPGFSWHNLKGAELGAIPRLKGKFLWSQFVAAKKAGAGMIYVAMFDEVDEGTAIFKCTNEPPTANGGKFLTYEGLSSDFYLKLTGVGAQMLRGEIPISEVTPDIY